MARHRFRSIVITGATSGIGRALADELAADGVVLGLAGRNRNRLDAVVASSEARGAEVIARAFDIAAADGIGQLVRDVESIAPVDLVVANAGVLNVIAPGQVLDKPGDAEAVISANLVGLLRTLDAALAVMVPRGSGHVALVSSMSAITPVPHAPTYSATKAAIKAYGDALRPRLRDCGIVTSVVIPGHVDTPMDQSYASPKPFKLPAAAAARRVVRGLEKNLAHIRFPFPLYMGAILAAHAPIRLRDWIIRRMEGTPLA